MLNFRQIKNSHRASNKGFVMLLTAIVFMLVSLIIVFGLATPIIKQILISRDIWNAKQSYYLSEAGIEDVLFRIKDSVYSRNVGLSETLSLDDFSTVTYISNTANGRTLRSESNKNDYEKHIESKLIQGSGVSFNYGIQAGNGGLTITGGSSINGNVYSNGDILGGSGIHIYGSAIAASGGVGIFSDETNNFPTVPTNAITFNNVGTNRDFAQSFEPGTTSPINKIRVYIKKTNSPGDFSVKLMTNNSGVPGTVLSQAVLYSGQVTTNYGWVDLVFNTTPTLTKDTIYWFVIVGDVKSNKTSTDTYTIGGNSSYNRGQAKIGIVGGSWNNTTPAGLDGYFSLYLDSTLAEIFGNEGDYMYIGSTTDDVGWASSIKHTRTTGIIYCESGVNNYGGKVCNTSRVNPEPIPMAISQANIDEWKAEAQAGGTTAGDLHIDWRGGSIGPRKITGNLLIDGGGTLVVGGTVWVGGTITVTGGGKIKVSPSLGASSAIILTDKYAAISGDGKFEGSGTSGSYPVLVSTSICPNTSPCSTNDSAISLTGGSGAVVLAAPFGKVNINGGSAVRAVSGDSIYISGGGSVNYDSGLASIFFNSGPSGGFEIVGWKELNQ